MPVIVEDGTGRADANSFIPVVYVDDYVANNGLQNTPQGLAWSAMTQDMKDFEVIRASAVTSNTERFPYSGTRKLYHQSMSWPRVDAKERNGPAVPPNYVPWQVEAATAEYALLAAGGEDINPAPSMLVGDIKRQSLDGGLSMTFFSAEERGLAEGKGTDLTYPSYGPDRLLYPLLLDPALSDMPLALTQPGVPFHSPQRDEVFKIGLNYECLAYPRVTSGDSMAQTSDTNPPTTEPPTDGGCDLPAGGAPGAILKKKTANDCDAEWVQDVDAGEF